MAQLNFDATQVPPETGFEPVPDGDYVAMIVDSEIKPTKTGNGMYLQLVWQVAEGQFAGRKIWDRLNVQNANKMAEEIAQKQLSAICHAVGVLRVRDSAELHNRPCKIGVVRKQDPGYQAANEVKRYSAVGAQPAAPAQQTLVPPAAAPARTAPPVTAAAKPPWVK